MEPGIYENLSFEEYLNIDAVNFSSLKELATSALQYKHSLEHPKADRPAFSMGRAVHTAVLQPDLFDELYTVYDGDRRKSAWKDFQESHSTYTILKPDDFGAIIRMAASVRSHPMASQILNPAGLVQRELTVAWIDPSTGIKCKGRIDSYSADGLVELKTTRNIAPRKFSRDVADLRYHIQLGMYSEGAAKAQNMAEFQGPPVYVIAVQNTAPYDCIYYEVSEQAVDVGKAEFLELLQKLKYHRHFDAWPGISEGLMELQLPDWAYNSDETADTTITMDGSPIKL